MPNIHGLHGNARDSSDSDDEANRDANNRYVGGIGAQGGGRCVAVLSARGFGNMEWSGVELGGTGGGAIGIAGKEMPFRSIPASAKIFWHGMSWSLWVQIRCDAMPRRWSAIAIFFPLHHATSLCNKESSGRYDANWHARGRCRWMPAPLVFAWNESDVCIFLCVHEPSVAMPPR